MPVQQQSNGVECGVCAIACISYVLSQHKSPIDAKFNTLKMISHLLHRLIADKVTEFPRREHAFRKCFEKTIKVMLYCSCRMPCKKSDNNVVDRQMAECSEDGFTECVKELRQLFSRKKVKIGTVSNALLMKLFSIWELDTLFLRWFVRDI